jgi:hypothetical protein
VFAINPKVMSTSSKLVAYALDHENEVPRTIPNKRELTYLGRLDNPGEFVRNARRVLFIRNPYARLYSAWTNKYRDMPGTCKLRRAGLKCDPFYDLWVDIGRKILAHGGVPVPEAEQDVLKAVTWELFLNAVLDEVVGDKHWRTQVWLAALCL